MLSMADQELKKDYSEEDKMITSLFTNIKNIRTSLDRVFSRDKKHIQALLKRRGGGTQILEDTMMLQMFQSYQTMEQLTQDLNPFISYYLCDLIIQTLADEALTEDVSVTSGNRIFSVSINQEAKNAKQLEQRVERIQDLFDLESIIKDILPDAIYWGDYHLRLKVKKGEGVTDIVDSVTPGTVLGLYRKHLPSVYYEDLGAKIVPRNPWEFWSFNLSHTKLKIDKNASQVNAPYHMRRGRPLFATLLPQIKDLIALETVDVAKEISDLTKSSLVSVNAPNGLDVDGQKDYEEYYERRLNESSGVDDNGNAPANIEKMVRFAGRLKVLLRDDLRGNVEPVNLRNQTIGDQRLQKIRDKRESISSATGVPFDILFSQTDANKGQNIKQYTTYKRRINNIQTSVAYSIKRLIAIDAAQVGIDIENFDDIQVNFLNSIDATQLEALEFLDTKVAMLSSARIFFEDLSSDPILGKRVDEEELATFFNGLLSTIKGADKIIRVGKDAVVKEPEEDDNTNDEDKERLDVEKEKAKQADKEEKEAQDKANAEDENGETENEDK